MREEVMTKDTAVRETYLETPTIDVTASNGGCLCIRQDSTAKEHYSKGVANLERVEHEENGKEG